MDFDGSRPDRDQAADQLRLLRGDLAPGQTVRLTMRSGSMLPLLPVGSQLEIAAVPGEACAVGDVVVFRRGDRLVAHRLLLGWGHAPGGWFLERGDGTSPVGFLRPGSILGRVTAVQLPDGEQRRLDDPQARLAGLSEARRSLARFLLRFLISGVRSPLRKARRWLQRGNTGSG